MKFDDQDKCALRKLDNNFTISADGETATVTGEMEVEVTRLGLADDGVDQFQLRFKFPGDELLNIKIRRVQLLEQLDMGDAKNS
jgi:hypothetical protein